jgi:hypothetical protein
VRFLFVIHLIHASLHAHIMRGLELSNQSDVNPLVRAARGVGLDIQPTRSVAQESACSHQNLEILGLKLHT